MALSETELRQEDLGQLRRLVQSPGWELLTSRLLRLVQRSESEKARLLRDGKPESLQQASRYQGEVDGIQRALTEVERYMKELAAEPGEPPTF